MSPIIRQSQKAHVLGVQTRTEKRWQNFTNCIFWFRKQEEWNVCNNWKDDVLKIYSYLHFFVCVSSQDFAIELDPSVVKFVPRKWLFQTHLYNCHICPHHECLVHVECYCSHKAALLWRCSLAQGMTLLVWYRDLICCLLLGHMKGAANGTEMLFMWWIYHNGAVGIEFAWVWCTQGAIFVSWAGL